MAGNLRMTSEDLRTANAQIKQKNVDLKDTLDQINRAVTNLNNTWRGEAANEAQEKMSEFMGKTYVQYEQAVQGYVDFIEATAARYDAAENAIHQNAQTKMDSSAVGDFT